MVTQDTLTTSKASCGAVAADNNTATINTKYWKIYGDAEGESGSTWAACEGPTGLWLGVRSGPSQWAGIYAESPNENVMLYHTHLVLPSSAISGISSNSFNTGLYVQTYNGLINYVTCYGQVIAGGGYSWGAELATGNTNQATNFVQLWTGPTFTNAVPRARTARSSPTGRACSKST